MQYGPLGQTPGVRVEIGSLPVEVPVLDVEQPLGLAVGQYSPAAERFAQVMGVGGDADEIHVHWEGERIRDSEVGLAWRDVDAGEQSEGRRQLEGDEGLLRRFGGKVDSECQYFLFRFAGGMKVGLHDQIGAFGQPKGQSVG